MRIRVAFFGVSISLVVLVIAFWPIHVVKVSLPKQNGRLVAAIRVSTDDVISLTYRHSVELTAVEGRFRVGPRSGLLAVETRMESVGSGLPNAFPDRTRMENGWMVVDEKQKPIGPLRFYVVPINQTRLKIADRSIDLTHLEPGALIQVDAERTHLLYWFWWAFVGV